jgi:hypothetical protein
MNKNKIKFLKDYNGIKEGTILEATELGAFEVWTENPRSHFNMTPQFVAKFLFSEEYVTYVD